MPTDQYLAAKVIDHITGATVFVAPDNLYLSLYADTECLIEITGGSYSRQTLVLPAVATNQFTTTTTSNVSFIGMPACTVQGAGVHDDVASGNRFFYAPTPTAIVVAPGDTVTFSAGQLVMGAT